MVATEQLSSFEINLYMLLIELLDDKCIAFEFEDNFNSNAIKISTFSNGRMNQSFGVISYYTSIVGIKAVDILKA